MRTFLLCGVGAAIIGAGAAFAQTAPVTPATPAPPQRIAKPQTRADVQAHVARMFARLDTNRDGFVTKQEADAVAAQWAGRMHQRMEQRGQGADRSKAFERLDSNHDGMISRQEFAAAPAYHGKGMGWGGMRGGFAGHMFEMADLNKDGRVSLPEAQQLALQHFDRADLNHDGTLTPDERRQSHELMRAQRRPA